MKLTEKEGSKPVYKVKVQKNTHVKMRDGVHLAVDIFRPDAEGKSPFLPSSQQQDNTPQDLSRQETPVAFASTHYSSPKIGEPYTAL